MALPIKEFDKWFSYWVRLQNVDHNGFTHCYTCGLKSWFKYLQCGHFMKRKNMSTRFEPIGAKPQCTTCNEIKDGNLKVYREKLIEEIGIERVEELERLGKQERKWSQSEMREQIEFYKQKAKELAKKKGIQL